MFRATFPVGIRPQLGTELVAAGVADGSFSFQTDSGPDYARNPGTFVIVAYEHEADLAVIQRVVAAHNPAAIDAAAAAEVQALQAVLDTRNAARALVLPIAQAAVGVRFDQLTANQLRALTAILFWQAGALDANGVVQPLAGWVR
jgi:hypothetical protein